MEWESPLTGAGRQAYPGKPVTSAVLRRVDDSSAGSGVQGGYPDARRPRAHHLNSAVRVAVRRGWYLGHSFQIGSHHGCSQSAVQKIS